MMSYNYNDNKKYSVNRRKTTWQERQPVEAAVCWQRSPSSHWAAVAVVLQSAGQCSPMEPAAECVGLTSARDLKSSFPQ